MRHIIKIRDLEIGSGIPKICAPITGKDDEMILEQARAIAGAGADLAEWRADFYENFREPEKIRQLLTAIKKELGQIPLLFTFRTKEEGGNCRIDKNSYVKLNMLAAGNQGADLIDVEIQFPKLDASALIAEIKETGTRVIASNHHFDRTPSERELEEIFDRMEEAQADIYKIAVMPHSYTDVTDLMAVTWKQAQKRPRPLVTMSMGAMGVLTRIAGETFGSGITFGTVGAASAPGQIPVEDLRESLQMIHRYGIAAK